ncbi:pyruvate dehydrogenase E1 component alpha subunit [Terrimicrobium sacchariphilum]|uniref:Pyruvate dehydrogenase E1 component alpha subunit n=1 Tax=Terrimicrobium sacchariphilum TaxID=690879 RepID=A0A146G299_TERSA|nr:thiamine pyrophosphate-dependent dehydrogenase E1 component subunit alpha [Terrimicrobium sacchariphilum]GAT31955.1 pyruvate dehydrogenase E1 component alpha subunit [Terrimicrobium sacchariphilum]
MSSDRGRETAPRTEYLKAYRVMLMARVLEEKLSSLYRAGHIKGGVFLGRGQEALSVSVGINLRKGDIYAPLIRDQAGRMAFGDTALDTLRTYLGSQLGSMRGRDGNIHRGRPREGYYAMISHLGAMIPTVTGALLARRFRGETGVVGATCIGDGGTSTGAFHEGLNAAAVEKLPLIMVVANNQYAYSTPNDRQYACADLLDKAAGYGVAGHDVDGTDLGACLEVLGKAVAAARAGGGPQLIVGRLLRLVGHGEHDDASYVDPALKASHVGRDCLKVAEDYIVENGWATPEEIASWRVEAKSEVDVTAAKVLREPAPDPNEEEWMAISETRLQDNFAA